MDMQQLDKTYIANTYARFPVQLTAGKGSLVTDVNGKEYIDLGTGIAVNAFGIADDAWLAAVTAQLSKLQHTSNLYYSEPCVCLAELLCVRTGMKKVFFSNSGAEANECAIKAARQYAADTRGAEYNVIITLQNSFHGRTLTTLAATGQDAFHKDFTPLTPGFVYAKPNDPGDVKRLVAENKCAGILFEAVQGEGGVVALDTAFIRELRSIADENDLVLMADEVQIGNGRSGALYGYMCAGIMPDVVSTAKGLAGGLPLGATLLGEKLKDVFKPGSHGSTFGGNPVCCAGAMSILSRLDDGFLAGVRAKSAYIINELTGAEGVRSVTGLGLMLGVETERDASEVLKTCMDNGVLVLKAKNKIRLLPALNIPDALLEKAIRILKQAAGSR